MASTKTRSFTKALSWRTLSTVLTAGYVWGITGRISFALYVMLFDVVIMTLVYYFHERFWKGIKWGKYPTDWNKYGWKKDDNRQ